MCGSSPRQKEQKGSSGFSARAPVLPGPLADGGGSYTSSTSQSVQRVNPWRYSVLHCGQYMSARLHALPAPKSTLFSTLARGHFYRSLTSFQLFLDFSLIFGTVNFVENYMWSAGACSRFSILDRPFQPLLVQNNRNRTL